MEKIYTKVTDIKTGHTVHYGGMSFKVKCITFNADIETYTFYNGAKTITTLQEYTNHVRITLPAEASVVRDVQLTEVLEKL